MDFTDPDSPIFGVWAIGSMFVVIGAVMFTGVNLILFMEHRNAQYGYDAQCRKRYARSVLKSAGTLVFAWLWPLALVVGGAWLGRLVLNAAEIPTPLSIYRASKQAKIEELERQLAAQKREDVKREAYVHRLEVECGVSA